MTDDERIRWLDRNRDIWDVPVPDGWQRMDTINTRARNFLTLHDDGNVYWNPVVSNASFIIQPPMAWRPA